MSIFTPNGPAVHSREVLQRAGPIPDVRLANFVQARDMSLTVRSPDSTSSSGAATFSCGPKDTTGPCERMVASNPNLTTIPVVLGVVIPLSVAFVVLVILHRRHVKKLRREDADDKHKSLDFGLDGAPVAEKRRRGRGVQAPPEMSAVDARNSVRRDRGMSLDLSMNNPYLLPPELQHSRESLHSLSRSVRDGDDKYRATNFIPDDGSLRSPSSLRHRDDASIYTYSSRQRADTDSTKGLLPVGQSHLHETTVAVVQRPPLAAKDPNTLLAPVLRDALRESYVSTNSNNENLAAMRASNNYLGLYISGGAKKKESEHDKTTVVVAELDGSSDADVLKAPPAAVLKPESSVRNSIVPEPIGFDFDIPPNTYELSSTHEPTLPHLEITPTEQSPTEVYEAPGHEIEVIQQSQLHDTSELEDPGRHTETGDSTVTEDFPQVHVVPEHHHEDEKQSTNLNQSQPRQTAGMDYYDDEADDFYDIDEYKDALGYDPRRLTMGLRPLPPDDLTENPEERALRIRSFYKEYFDETTKPGGDKTRLSYFDGSENYIDDYYGSNNHISYDHGPYGHGSFGYSQYGPPRGHSQLSSRGPSGRHRATISNGSFMSGGQGPRAYSSASQRYPGQPPRFAPRKKAAPPPQPLQILPTPSMLKDDSMLPNAIDFAPPQVFKNQRSGTPDSLKGGLKPYSPVRKAHNPLVSSFDDLSVLPSPHQFRKSGTFNSLDFAPPRFAAPSNGSDSGSIRSNRSGMSAMQLQHIRAGAYRLSRIPKEVAGTREELAHALKPQWNAR